jgi:hypothetical protein
MHDRLKICAVSVLMCGWLWALPGAAQTTPPAVSVSAAARADAARTLVPLLKPVKQRAESKLRVQTGTGSPNSPFAGRPTTAVSVSISGRDTPPDPEVMQAMDLLLRWKPEDRGDSRESQLFDRWLGELERRATALTIKSGSGACDIDCVKRTMTVLDDTWGTSPRQRDELRDQTLLEALTMVVKGK